jgi:hypothetical protein
MEGFEKSRVPRGSRSTSFFCAPLSIARRVFWSRRHHEEVFVALYVPAFIQFPRYFACLMTLGGDRQIPMFSQKGCRVTPGGLCFPCDFPPSSSTTHSWYENDVTPPCLRMQSNGDSTPDSSEAHQRHRARLPVNPRRIKVPPAERKRVVRA